MNIYIVNGKPESGKTTFEKNLKQICATGTCFYMSIIDMIKSAAKDYFGYYGEKSDKDRKFLADLKDLCADYNNSPINRILEKVEEYEYDEKYYFNNSSFTLLIDAREPKDIEELKTKLNAKTILIKRPDVDDKEYSNHADTDVDDYNYDIIIENNGNLRDWALKAVDFAKTEKLTLPISYEYSDSYMDIDLFGNITYIR